MSQKRSCPHRNGIRSIATTACEAASNPCPMNSSYGALKMSVVRGRQSVRKSTPVLAESPIDKIATMASWPAARAATTMRPSPQVGSWIGPVNCI